VRRNVRSKRLYDTHTPGPPLSLIDNGHIFIQSPRGIMPFPNEDNCFPRSPKRCLTLANHDRKVVFEMPRAPLRLRLRYDKKGETWKKSIEKTRTQIRFLVAVIDKVVSKESSGSGPHPNVQHVDGAD